MTKEQELLIHILSDYVNGIPVTDVSGDINWDTLYQLGAKQSLLGIVYVQVRNAMSLYCKDSNAARKIHRGFLIDVYLDKNREIELSHIHNLFSEECIPHIMMKGNILKDYYPNPELRTMGDIDFIIRTDDREKSNHVMLRQGYRRKVDNHAVWTYLKDDEVFEIHDHMFYEQLTNKINYREYFNHVWEHLLPVSDSKSVFYPTPIFHFLYLIAHTAKHVINNGMGFRAFLDLTFFCKNYYGNNDSEVDWNYIQKELKKLRLYEFTCTCFSLCENWFGIQMPFSRKELNASFIQLVTEKMFDDGIFGLSNPDNCAAHSAKEIRRSNESYQMAAMKLSLRKLFPPYEDMQLIPWYAWVDGKPWLMPAAWVYRWFYCLKNKRTASRDLLLEPYEKRRVIEARERYLEQWGL